MKIDGVNEIKLLKSKRAKKLRITIKPGGSVIVTVPHLLSFRNAKKFVIEKQDWIRKHVVELSKKSNQTVFNEHTDFETNLHKLLIKRTTEKKIKGRITATHIEVYIPKSMDIYSAEIQSFIRKSIEESWRIEAKQILPILTKTMAEKHGLTYQKVSVRNSVSRWGSCSFHNSINYSLHLMRLPIELQEYVILHELAHTKEKNHQPPFWNLLNTLTDGKARLLDKQLKNYSTRVY